MTTTTTQHQIPGPAGMLQAELASPEVPDWRALLCHPHPQFGGTMNNKVVHTLFRLCRDHQAAAVRFNFRGVGSSEGEFDHARGEVEDAIAVEQWLASRVGYLPLWLAGFSFGSFVALRVAGLLARQGRPAHHLVLVAPPVHYDGFEQVVDVGCPVTVIQGTEDEVVDPESVYQWATSSPVRPHLYKLDGASHFFHGQLHELKAVAEKTLDTTFITRDSLAGM